MPNFNGDVVFVDTSGQVRAQSGDLTLRADSTNTRAIIVGSGSTLRPDRDYSIDLGLPFLRWNNAHITSGVFNTIGAPTSGTFISVAASLVPNRTNIYALGTGSARWANIFATSGNILNVVANDINTSTFTAGSAIIDDLTLSNTLTFPQTAGGSFTINQLGSLLWSADGFDVAVINMSQWDWGTANLIGIGTTSTDTLSVAFDAAVFGNLATNTLETTNGADILGMLETENIRPQSDRLYAIGTSALRYSRMHAASGLFNTLGPQTSGTYLNVIGSLVPEIDALYSLGTSSLRWSNIFAVSGIFSARPTVNGSGVLLQ